MGLIQMKILADKTLPNLTALFQTPFSLTLYHTSDEIPRLLQNQDILICRSTLKVTAELLQHSSIRYVATASSGTDHIDCDYLKSNDIKLFDAKGSNACAVADYIIATFAYLQQSGKLHPKCVGIMGIGEVGTRVSARLKAVGFQVVCFDPLKALQNPEFKSSALSDILECDVLCLHMNLHNNPPYASNNLINAEFLNRLKPNTTIINAARGGIVEEKALLHHPHPIQYCTDVYTNEPNINPELIDYATLCTPHIAGHSIEAKRQAVMQISQQLHHHFGLPMPSIDEPLDKVSIILSPDNAWQEVVLNLYNPIEETRQLKKAINKTEAFSRLRLAHQNRHDFAC